jgi:hypothetical protein
MFLAAAAQCADGVKGSIGGIAYNYQAGTAGFGEGLCARPWRRSDAGSLQAGADKGFGEERRFARLRRRNETKNPNGR